MRLVVRWLAMLSMLWMAAACETVVPEPTATPDIPTPGMTITATVETEVELAPTRQPQIESTPFFGRSIEASRSTAIIRIIHAASQAPALDIYLADAEIAGGLGYSLSTGLTNVLPGTYSIRAQPRRDPTVLEESSVTLTAGRTTEVVIAPDGDGIQFILVDGRADPLEAGTSVARVVNALPDSGELRVTLNGTEIPDVLELGGVTELYTFDEGELTAAIESGGAEILSSAFRLRALTNMLLVVAGPPDRPQLVVFESPVLGRYSLRVINVSPAVREIDVYFDGDLVAANLAYQSTTERTVYATAPALVSVHAANADLAVSNPLLDGYRVTPRPGSTATLAIFGLPDNLQAMWIEEDLTPVPVGQSRVIFAHVLPGVNALRAGVNSSDLEELRPFNFGNVSDPVLFDEGELRLFFRDAAVADNIVELRGSVPIPAGSNLLYFVTGGSLEDETPPVVFSDPVGVDETLTSVPSETTRGTYRVRYINAIVSQPVIDVLQDGDAAVAGLQYGEGTELLTLSADSVQVLARMNGSPIMLVDQHIGLPDPGDYSIFIFGTPENGITTSLINDSALPSATSSAQVPTMRLINLTQDPSARFGLALLPAQTSPGGLSTPVPTPQPTPTVAGSSEIDLGRRTLPIGVPIPIIDIVGGKTSRQAMGQPNSTVYVINQLNEIVVSVGTVAFAPGTHTDVVVYEYRTATAIEAIAFPLVYPTR